MNPASEKEDETKTVKYINRSDKEYLSIYSAKSQTLKVQLPNSMKRSYFTHIKSFIAPNPVLNKTKAPTQIVR